MCRERGNYGFKFLWETSQEINYELRITDVLPCCDESCDKAFSLVEVGCDRISSFLEGGQLKSRLDNMSVGTGIVGLLELIPDFFRGVAGSYLR